MGPDIIKNDPHSQNKNGKLLKDFLMRNPDLHLLNSESFCEGLITRSRIANNKTEQSVIDFVIVCEKVLPFVQRFLIDEQKIYALSNYSKKKTVLYSDHNSLVTKLNFKYVCQKPERKTLFNFRDQTGMLNFKLKTSKYNSFQDIFKKQVSFENQTSSWIKTLKKTIAGCFKKVRLSDKKRKKIFFFCQNFKRRKQSIINKDNKLQNKAEELLRRQEAINHMNVIKNNINSIKNSKNSQSAIWKVKGNIFPKIKPPLPVAKRNLAGKLITNSEELKKVYLKHFHHRMRNRPILNKYQKYKNNIEKEFSETLKLTKNINFPDWDIRDLDLVLKALKKSQSPDHMGFINELFMPNNIGEDLKISMLHFFNSIKNTQQIPDFF